MVFFYIKTPLRVKEAGLEELIPTTWWPTHFDKEVRGAASGPGNQLDRTGLTRLVVLCVSQGKDEREPKDESADERLRRRAYERGCQRLKKRIEGWFWVGLSCSLGSNVVHRTDEMFLLWLQFWSLWNIKTFILCFCSCGGAAGPDSEAAAQQQRQNHGGWRSSGS